MPGGVLVIIPTYNEAGNLPGVVERLRACVPDAHVLIADDNSPDGTGDIADDIAAKDDHVHVLHRPGKEGLGKAYLAGFAWALERGYDVVVEMDADGSHRPEELPRLLEQIAHADVVLGSRWVPGGAVVNWPAHRRLLSQGGSLYTRMALGIPTRDATGGYRAYRATALESLDLGSVDSNGYCFQIDLLWRSLQRGLVVREVPITFVEREVGDSKMSGRIVREALANVTRWGALHRWAQISGRRGE
jgi:dolichol-phosphate mannosyltransferase